LRNEECYDVYPFNTDHFDHFNNVFKSRRMRCTGCVASMRNKTNVYRVWWENLKERDQRPRQRSEDSIKINIKETGWEDIDWIYVA